MSRGARREGRRSNTLFVVTVILLVIAVGSAVGAFVVRHDTDALDSKAATVRRQVHEVVATERHAEARTRTLRANARATNDALSQLFAAFAAQVDASNHAVDVANQAVDTYNNAGSTNLVGAFRNAGDTALGDLETRTQAVRTAAQAVQQAIASLQGAVDG
jgi:hypothetical protein